MKGGNRTFWALVCCPRSHYSESQRTRLGFLVHEKNPKVKIEVILELSTENEENCSFTGDKYGGESNNGGSHGEVFNGKACYRGATYLDSADPSWLCPC